MLNTKLFAVAAVLLTLVIAAPAPMAAGLSKRDECQDGCNANHAWCLDHSPWPISSRMEECARIAAQCNMVCVENGP